MRSSRTTRARSRYASRRTRLPFQSALAFEPLEQRALLSVTPFRQVRVVEYDVATQTQRTFSLEESQAAFSELLATAGSAISANRTSSQAGVPIETFPSDSNGPSAASAAFNPEDRTHVPVNQVTEYPFVANARLSADFVGDGQTLPSNASATIIGPYHAITAAHTIFDRELTREGFAKRVTISPAQDGDALTPLDNQRSDYQPYGQARATLYRTFDLYTEDNDLNWDIAMITLDRNIGNFMGHYGFGYDEDDNFFRNNTATVTSYPGTGSGLMVNGEVTDGMKMFTQSGNAVSYGITPYQLRTNTMNSAKGQSGAGVSVGDETVFGVVSHGFPKAEAGPLQYVAFTRITADVFDFFAQGMVEDDTEIPAVDRPDLVDADKWFDEAFANTSRNAVNIGDSLTVGAYVYNMGTAAAGSFNVRYRLSTDQNYDTTDPFLGDATVSSLSPFKMTNPTLTANCPDISIGDYYLVWTIDSANAVIEFSGTNNEGASIFTIDVRPKRDVYEENDTFETASALGSMGVISIQDLTIHVPSNEDYFSFTASATGTATVAIAFTESEGKLTLHVYDANQTLLKESTFVRVSSQTLEVPVTAGQTYYVKVKGYESSDLSADYSMSIAGPPIAPDGYEANDSFETASDLGSPSNFAVENLTIHESGNDDYYSFVAGLTGSANVRVMFSYAAGDLDLYIYDAGFSPVFQSTGTVDYETATFPITAGQTYYFKVVGYAGAINGSYALSLAQGNPEIDVKGGSVSIADGDMAPGIPDGTDFGRVDVGNSVLHTFTIFNSGNVPLLLNGSNTIELDDTTNFILGHVHEEIAPGESYSFDIEFAPTDALPHVANITIPNNDPDEAPYNFAIQGNAPPPISVSIGDIEIVEGNSGTRNAVFTVRLSARPPQTVFVNYATAEGTAWAGSDYTSTTGILTFRPRVSFQTISVPIKGDGTLESNESFVLNLSNAVNATILDGQGVGTILNDDKPVISITDTAVLEGAARERNQAVFTVRLSEPTTQTVKVKYATVKGTATPGNNDYNSKSGELTFQPGITSQQIFVTVKGDNREEPNELFTVKLSSPTGATIGYNTGICTILNDDGINPTGLTTVASTPARQSNVVRASSSTTSAAPSSAKTLSQPSFFQTVAGVKKLKVTTQAPSAAAADFVFGVGLRL